MKVFDEANPANANGKNKNNQNTSNTSNGKNNPSGSGFGTDVYALSGFLNTNQKLQDQISQLTRQNYELKQLERLRPQLMELQQRVAVMQEEHFKGRVKFVEETAALTESNQELQLQLKAANRSLEGIMVELADAKAYAENQSQRVKEFIILEQQLRSDLELERKNAQEVASKLIDPCKYHELENMLSEALGKKYYDY
jgi:t-SNARE complex subunit (syntaxin)